MVKHTFKNLAAFCWTLSKKNDLVNPKESLEIVAKFCLFYQTNFSKLINLYSPLKSSEKLWFSDKIRGNGK